MLAFTANYSFSGMRCACLMVKHLYVTPTISDLSALSLEAFIGTGWMYVYYVLEEKKRIGSQVSMQIPHPKEKKRKVDSQWSVVALC